MFGAHRVSTYAALLDDAVAEVSPVHGSPRGRRSGLTPTSSSPRRTPSCLSISTFTTSWSSRSAGRNGSVRVASGVPPFNSERSSASSIRGAPPDHLPAEDRQTFSLGPGDGLHIPAHTFHWIEGADDVSIAMACVIATALTERAHTVHRFNEEFAALGPRAHPPGISIGRDRAKAEPREGVWALRDLAGKVARKLRR